MRRDSPLSHPGSCPTNGVHLKHLITRLSDLCRDLGLPSVGVDDAANHLLGVVGRETGSGDASLRSDESRDGVHQSQSLINRPLGLGQGNRCLLFVISNVL
jgi:hypothetical protein